ncbi:MAG: WG repeat-containing protein [Bacteroidales bacterium]|nr:WG repeat-containing protein [Bacteroidales bacterium]
MKLIFFLIAIASTVVSSCGNDTQQTKENGPAIEVLSKDVYAVLSAKYDKIGDFNGGHAFVHDSNEKMGCIDNQGNVLLECVYDYILDRIEDWDVGFVMLNDAWGIFNKDYKMLTKCIYDMFNAPHDGLVTLSIAGHSKYGALDITDGSIVIPFDYYHLGDYSEGLFAAEIKGTDRNKAGFIDRNNQVVIPFIYSNADDFSEGLAAVHKYDKTVYSRLGSIPSQKCGFINTKGDVVIPFKFNWQISTLKFSEGLCAIGTSKNNDRLYEINCNSFIDMKGDVVISGLFDDAEPFENGVSRIKKNDKYGYINRKGEIIIPCQYDDYHYEKDCLCLEKDGTKYYFTYGGDLIIK